ncbi:uncharacterized protein LY79DRAFT_575145 [Colletotrichum navitas]|uniref:Uncharacterized protein n=1 Tax=Colletotrichum navitas TaxID=681940 RepID=A0AAD8QBC8_9PEZI|nr:uncharacterized protein LY79DRAFT_575145 [Colletotrichum navitas]KAK1599446.1 hypothetical protein LY79DRAFT_575145 [Colletotrichum navitas]
MSPVAPGKEAKDTEEQPSICCGSIAFRPVNAVRSVSPNLEINPNQRPAYHLPHHSRPHAASHHNSCLGPPNPTPKGQRQELEGQNHGRLRPRLAQFDTPRPPCAATPAVYPVRTTCVVYQVLWYAASHRAAQQHTQEEIISLPTPAAALLEEPLPAR